MSRDIEDLISKCMAGNVSREIIHEIEEELPDIEAIKKNLIADMRRERVFADSVVCENYNIVVHARKSTELMNIIETYNRTYLEIEVYVA